MFRPWRHGMALRPWLLSDHTSGWPPTTPQPSALWGPPLPYLVGVIFIHPSLAVILAGQGMESRVLAPATPSTAGPGWGAPGRLGRGEGLGARGQGSGGEEHSEQLNG